MNGISVVDLDVITFLSWKKKSKRETHTLQPDILILNSGFEPPSKTISRHLSQIPFWSKENPIKNSFESSVFADFLTVNEIPSLGLPLVVKFQMTWPSENFQSPTQSNSKEFSKIKWKKKNSSIIGIKG